MKHGMVWSSSSEALASLEPDPAGAAGRRSPLLAVLSLTFACVGFDNAKLVHALPTLTHSLDPRALQPALSGWIAISSLIVYASLLLLGGALSERFGVRRVLVVGLGLFAVGSVAAAASGTLLALCAARAVVGVGAALMTPASLAAIKHASVDSERPRAIAIWTASFAAAAALGPVVGGVLLERWGWRSSMLANLPGAALALLGAVALVPGDWPRRVAPLDPAGVLLGLTGGVGAMLGLLGGIGRGAAALALAVGLGAYVLLLAWQRRNPHPMIAPVLFENRALRSALLVIVLSYFAFAGVSFASAQHWQLVRAHGPQTASLLNLPLPLALLAGTLLAPRHMARLGARRALWTSLGLALLGAVLVGIAFHGRSDLWACAALIPFAVGAGSAFPNATELVLSAVPEERAGAAAAVSETAFELGGALGIALLGAPAWTSAALPAASAAAAGAAGALVCALVIASLRARRPG